MKKNITVSYLALFVIILTIITTVLLLSSVPKLISELPLKNEGRLNAYLSIIGNVSGGLIGGLVAYIVAAYQVSKSKEHDIQKNIKESYMTLSLLLDELEYNYKVFKSTNMSEENVDAIIKHLQNQLVTNQWNNINPVFANHMDKNDFKNICNLYRNIQFIRNSSESINDNYLRSCMSLSKDIIDNINEELNELNKKIE